MIDLNADIGEETGNDTALLAVITSASIACGGHAGTAATMRSAVKTAIANGVRIGAHPGFEDREHFGRRRLDLPTATIVGQVLGQIEALADIVAQAGGDLSYLKLHGALANMAAEDEKLAQAIFSAAARFQPDIAIMALAASAQERAADALNMPVIAEAYADRSYLANGLLVPREREGAVITDRDLILERCLRLARHGELVAIDGQIIKSRARSICLHGDTDGAVALANAVRSNLESAGYLPPSGGVSLSIS